LIPGAIEETLRYDPSVPVWRRITKRAVAIAGVEIPEGAKLFLWLAAAGRDRSVFSDPDVFDLRRDNAKRHLAFGKASISVSAQRSASSKRGLRWRRSRTAFPAWV
jgi:cytochrome P450